MSYLAYARFQPSASGGHTRKNDHVQPGWTSAWNLRARSPNISLSSGGTAYYSSGLDRTQWCSPMGGRWTDGDQLGCEPPSLWAGGTDRTLRGHGVNFVRAHYDLTAYTNLTKAEDTYEVLRFSITEKLGPILVLALPLAFNPAKNRHPRRFVHVVKEAGILRLPDQGPQAVCK